MSKTIVVVGSVNMDLVLHCPHLPLPGETVQGFDFRTLPGGKGANQAVAAARLGATVAFVGCVGADSFGQQAIGALRTEGIDLTHMHIMADQATGVAAVLVESSGENSIALAAGANQSLSIAHVDAAAERIRSAGLLVCQLETPLPAVQRAISIAAASGVPVLLNPAPAQALPPMLLRQVDWLVPNQREAAFLSAASVENPAAACVAAQSLRERGVQTVVVTLGAQGVVWVDADGCTHRKARPVRAVDTTGAGDAFVGALAVALVDGRGVHDAIEFAQRAAAHSVERKGAQTSMPYLSDIAIDTEPQEAGR